MNMQTALEALEYLIENGLLAVGIESDEESVVFCYAASVTTPDEADMDGAAVIWVDNSLPEIDEAAK